MGKMKKYSILLGSVLLLSGLWSCSKMPAEYSNYPDTLSVSEASVPENTPVYKRTEYIYKDGSRSLNSEEICDEHDNVIKSDPTDSETDGLSYRVCYRYLYDENGNVLKKAAYSKDGSLSSYSLNTYNADGTPKAQVQYSHSSSDDLQKKRYLCYEYDSSGNVTNRKLYENNGDLSVDISYKYKYDSSGNTISKTVENNLLHEIEEKYTYTYDDKGDLVTEKRETPEPFISETHMTYDDNGNVISSVTKTTVASGTTESDTKNTYDDKGRLIRSESYDTADNSTFVTEYEYEDLEQAE